MEINKLIERCKQGDATALGELYKTYERPMRRVCRRYVSDKQTINDILHDSFVVIFTSFDKLRDTSKAENWIMSITRNVASKYKNYQKNHKIVSLEKSNQAELYLEDSPTSNDISLSELISMVDKLPEGYGQIFRLAVFNGMSHQEIGTLLNIAPHTSSSQLARAKKMLRKMIQQYWPICLLLIIPILFFFLKRENNITNEDIQIVVNQEETTNTQSAESEQTPLIIEQPAQHTVVCTTDTIRKSQRQINNIVVSDTPKFTEQIATATDTLCDEQSHDTIEFIQKMEAPYYDHGNVLTEIHIAGTDNTQKWSLGFAYSGSFVKQTLDILPLVFNPKEGDDSNGRTTTMDTREITYINHSLPITLSLMAHYKQSKRLGLETGLSYIRLNSELKYKTDDTQYKTLQTIHYLGIPLKGTYTLCKGKKWSLYGNLGCTMGIPVHSKFNTEAFTNNSDTKARWLWSVCTGLGLQYNVTRNIGIFTEPSVQYYIPTQKGLETYCTEHPFAFALPLGIKFIW